MDQPAYQRRTPRPTPISSEERASFTPETKCRHCGGWHARSCPRVRRMVMTGEAITEVEFWPWDEWPHDLVVWPEALEQERS